MANRDYITISEYYIPEMGIIVHNVAFWGLGVCN